MYLSSWLPSDVITCSPITTEDHHKPVLGTVYFYRAQDTEIWKFSAEYGQHGEAAQPKPVLHLQQPTRQLGTQCKNCQGMRFQSAWVTCSAFDWLFSDKFFLIPRGDFLCCSSCPLPLPFRCASLRTAWLFLPKTDTLPLHTQRQQQSLTLALNLSFQEHSKIPCEANYSVLNVSISEGESVVALQLGFSLLIGTLLIELLIDNWSIEITSDN